ncbi:MAG: GPR endopeptidase [Clostridia bacterium]|nr:GPR endopeptidase [Clostridia bacterium]
MNQAIGEHRWESDLACERQTAHGDIPGVDRQVQTHGELSWERIRIVSEEGAAHIGRPQGHYDTLTTPPMDTLGEEVKELATEAVRQALQTHVERALGHPAASLLAVGLGNASMTADAIGPLTAKKIHATRHIRAHDEAMFRALACAEIAVMRPGVSAQSGLDAADTVAEVCRFLKPDVLLVFDALAARSTDRLGCTVQLSDTGIAPGSGVGNHRRPLDESTLHVPVIAIGVPTVTDSRIFFSEEAARRGLSANGADDGVGMFVSPRGIDDIVETASDILSEAVNRAFGISFL